LSNRSAHSAASKTWRGKRTVTSWTWSDGCGGKVLADVGSVAAIFARMVSSGPAMAARHGIVRAGGSRKANSRARRATCTELLRVPARDGNPRPPCHSIQPGGARGCVRRPVKCRGTHLAALAAYRPLRMGPSCTVGSLAN
jgi:hypothetical protein